MKLEGYGAILTEEDGWNVLEKIINFYIFSLDHF